MTEATSPLHVVLGASGGTGAAVMRELAARGHRVRAVNRSGQNAVPEGVERLAADVSKADGARAAAAGAAVVYHCAQPAYHRWPEEFPAMNENVIAGAAAASSKLVFADNLYMYGPTTGPLSEGTPQRAEGKKGPLRRAMAERLLEVHRAGWVRITMGRASDYFGPGGIDSGAGERLFGAALAGKAVDWPANLDQPRTFSYLPDMARALVTLGERVEADGQAWHLPAAEPITARAFIGLACAAAGTPLRVRATPKLMMRAVGLLVPPARELPDIWHQFDRPFVSDASRFQATFGPFDPTPHEEAIPATVEWFRRRAM